MKKDQMLNGARLSSLHSRLPGSVFGGVFTQYSTWRTLFWFTAGVTVIPLVLGYFVVPQDRLEPGRDTRKFSTSSFRFTFPSFHKAQAQTTSPSPLPPLPFQ